MISDVTNLSFNVQNKHGNQVTDCGAPNTEGTKKKLSQKLKNVDFLSESEESPLFESTIGMFRFCLKKRATFETASFYISFSNLC